MPLFKAFQWVQHIKNLMFFSSKFNQKRMLFLMPHSGRNFLRLWCDLMPKCSIWGPRWRPAGRKMAAKIAQVSPKGSKKASGALTFYDPGKRLASNITFGAFLGTILVDFGTPRVQNHGFPHHFLHIFVLDRCCQN